MSEPTTKYVTRAEVLEWLKIQDDTFTVDSIPPTLILEAEAKVDAELVNRKCFDIDGNLPTTSDEYNFLKFAAYGFLLSIMCQTGLVGQTTGEIMSNSFGQVRYQYQRTNPLFFFATGTSEPFMELLPYETLRMYAYSFIKAYCLLNFYNKTGNLFPKPKTAIDKSSRGYRWNVSVDESDLADSETGEVLEGAEDYR